LNSDFSPCPTSEKPFTFWWPWTMKRTNSPQACTSPTLGAPSQNGTPSLIHAYIGSPTWVRCMPSHISTSYHLLHSQGCEVCIVRCS
jgi:hypothetical protein